MVSGFYSEIRITKGIPSVWDAFCYLKTQIFLKKTSKSPTLSRLERIKKGIYKILANIIVSQLKQP